MKGTYISSHYILNPADLVCTTYDNSWFNFQVNNPPPIQVFVRSNGDQFIINKKVMPTLLLKHGQKYQFNIVTHQNLFYFTSTPNGKADIFNIAPNNYDLRTYTPMDNIPKEFYYTNGKGTNGKVKILPTDTKIFGCQNPMTF